MLEELYIPFQTLSKSKIHKLLNYGQPYSNYSTYKIVENSDNIECIYIDNQPYNYRISQSLQSMQSSYADILEEANLYYVEIHYKQTSSTGLSAEHKQPSKIIMSSGEIDKMIEKYSVKL